MSYVVWALRRRDRKFLGTAADAHEARDVTRREFRQFPSTVTCVAVPNDTLHERLYITRRGVKAGNPC